MGSTEDAAAHVGSSTWHRRHRNRGSGGFLLDPLAKTNASTVFSDVKQDRKGKRRSENVEPITPERGSQTLSDQDDKKNGSPLSRELAAGAENGGSSYAPSPSLSVSTSISLGRNGRPASSTTSNTSNVGFDTDPARIVDMALRLSEGRRRQASGKRNVSTEISGHNVVNIQSPGHMVKPAAALQSPEQATTLQNIQSDRTSAGDSSGPRRQKFEPSPGLDTDNEATFEISKATARRVDKAKNYIELACEYHRLLPHLPPIRRPTTQVGTESIASGSRIYNPLQYARNRKLRLREKAGLTAEFDGWHDITKVRPWVDAAISSHAETRHEPNECVRLPPFSQHQGGDDNDDKDFPASPQSKQANRQRRPKSDWMTHPGSLLADAYWLEQGLNKTKIQDRDNHTIYPAGTQFKYAGWGQRATVDQMPDSLQQKQPPTEDAHTESILRSPLLSAPVLPKFQSTRQKSDNTLLLNRPRKLKQSLVMDAKDTTRKALDMFEKSLETSCDSDSSSTEPEDDQQRRGRRKDSTRPFQFNLPVGNPSATSTADIDHVGDSSDSERMRKLTWAETNSVGISNKNKSRGTSQELENPAMRRGSSGSKEKPEIRSFSSNNRGRSGNRSKSSRDRGSAASASVPTRGIPSIEINSSPTESRTSSPGKKGKGILGSIREKRRGKNHDHIETNDFAQLSHMTHSRDPSTDADTSRNGSGNDSRGTSPFDKARKSSVIYEGQKHGPSSNHGSISRTSTKSTIPNAEHHPRIKGMFKGGRIAEIVGTEVSKVGDYIWKRDPPAERHYPNSVSDQDSPSRQTSDSEDDNQQNGYAYITPPRNIRGSLSSTSTHTGPRTSMEKAEDKNQYYNPNLPSFVSPFQRDREKQARQADGKQSASPRQSDTDHIALQVEQHRSRSRSPRLDRLAPPKLDTTGSPDHHHGSNGFGGSLDLSKSRSASQIYNEAIGRAADPSDSATNLPQLSEKSKSSMSVHRKSYPVYRGDLSRIETLLLISAVKANGIMSVQSQPLNKDGTLSDSVEGEMVARKSQYDEHVTIVRGMITRLAEHNTQFNDRLHQFSKSTVANLHTELQLLEDHTENSLMPKARAAADNAGELSMKLTTTSTLASKDLNDTISEAFRLRKRGPFRWLRSLGYLAIEWAVVGFLWLIWAVVTIIRICLGVFKLGARASRWLLWID